MVPLVSRAANLSQWGNEVKCFSLYREFLIQEVFRCISQPGSLLTLQF